MRLTSRPKKLLKHYTVQQCSKIWESLPFVTDPAVNASAAREDPQDVLEPKVLPQGRIDDLTIAASALDIQYQCLALQLGLQFLA